MPDDSPFILKVDNSALDQTIEKAKKTATELTNALSKASDSVKASLAKAFAPNQINTWMSGIQSKLAELQSSSSLKTTFTVDVSQVGAAQTAMKALESQVAAIQYSAKQAASALEDNIVRAVKRSVQQIKLLGEEQKKVQESLASATSPAAGVTIFPEYRRELQAQRRAIEKEVVQTKTVLQQLQNLYREFVKVQNSVDSIAVEVSNSPTMAKAIQKVSKNFGEGVQMALPKGEIAKDLRDYVLWHQEQTNKARDDITKHLENMEHAIGGRLRSLPDPLTSDLPRKRAEELKKTKKELEALYNEVAGLRNKSGTPHDIIGALEGPALGKMYEQFLKGLVGVDELNAQIVSRIDAYTAKSREITSKYLHLMEAFPEHIKAGGERIVPGLSGQAQIPVTIVDPTPAEIKGLQNRIALLQGLSVQSEKTKQEIASLQAQLAYFERGGKITQVPELQEGVTPNVRHVTHGYREHEFTPEALMSGESVEKLEEYRQALAGLDIAYRSSADSEELFADRMRNLGTIIGFTDSKDKLLLEYFQQNEQIAMRARRLFDGVKQSATDMPSVAEKIKEISGVARESLMKPGFETFDLSEKLKGSIGNATGYVRREFADTTKSAHESLLKLKMISEIFGEEITAPFKSVINYIRGYKDEAGVSQGIGPKFNMTAAGPFGTLEPVFKNFEDRMQRINALMMQFDTRPAETAPKLESELLGMSNLLTGVAGKYKDIRNEASDMASAFRIQPIMSEIQAIFNNPALSSQNLIQAQVAVAKLNEKFDQMVKYAPELEPLRQKIRQITDEFISTKAITVTEHPQVKQWTAEAEALKAQMERLKEQKPKGIAVAPGLAAEADEAQNRRAVDLWKREMESVETMYNERMQWIARQRGTPIEIDEAGVRAAFTKFDTQLQPFKRQLNFSQIIGDALTNLSRLGREAGDVGSNASMMLDKIFKLVEMVSVATKTGLVKSESEELQKMMAEMNQYTVHLKSEHLPVVEALGKEYQRFGDKVQTVIGGFLSKTERGALPNIIREKFAPPEFDEAMPLEEWLGSLSGGHRFFKPIGGEHDKSFIEQFAPPGSERGKQLTVADMFGTGRLELIDQATGKQTQFGKAVEFVKSQLREPGKFESFYQPAMQYTQRLTHYIQTLRAEIIETAKSDPKMASMVLALDTAQSKVFHTTESFKALKRSIEGIGPTQGAFSPNMSLIGRELAAVTDAATKSIDSHVQQFQERLKGILQKGGPQEIYGAIKEAMKLPVGSFDQPISSQGIGQILFGGGNESLIRGMSFERLTQIKAGLGEYFQEVVESGWGAGAIKRAQAIIKRLYTGINEEMHTQRAELLSKGEQLPTLSDETILPSRWAQEPTEKFSKQMKSATRAVMEALVAADTETFPDTAPFVQKISTWSVGQIDKIIKTLKQKTSQKSQEFAKALVPGELAESPEQEKMLIQMMNWERAIASAEKVKQGKLDELRRKRTAAAKDVGVEGEDVLTSEAISIAEAAPGAGRKIVESIDSVTAQKVAALKRQIAQMKGAGGAAALVDYEKGMAEGIKQPGFLETVLGPTQIDPVKQRLSNLINPFVQINAELENLGMVFSRQGRPVAAWSELLKAGQTTIMDLIKEVAKVSPATDTLDEHIMKFNATASDEKKVMTFASLLEMIQSIKIALSVAIPEYQKLVDTGDFTGAAAKREDLVSTTRLLTTLMQELARSESAVVSNEFLIEDLRRREITTLRELGQAYRIHKLEAQESIGPLASASRAEQAKAALAGRDILRQSVISAQWRGEKTTEPGGPFEGIGEPVGTIADVSEKMLGRWDQLANMRKGIVDVINTYRTANKEFEYGVAEPKNLDDLIAKLMKFNRILEEGKNLPPTWQKSYENAFKGVQPFLQGVLEAANKASTSAGRTSFAEKWAGDIQKARDEAAHLIIEMQELTKLMQSTPRGAETQQKRIAQSERAGELLERAGVVQLEMSKDSHTPSEEMRLAAAATQELKAASSGNLSLWERITNTVKTTRNNFADLFMYQVRWYTSMMIFWGVFNKVGETFKALVETQHQIQRAVRAMREESGEIVQHWARLEHVAQANIFENMVKWATDAKQAGEVLWQLGSAGLNASESLAALGPVLGLIRASEGDTTETTKIVAGVFNVLQDSIEGAAQAGTKFRIITDVIAKVFRDHQVELSELNQGYRFAISSADTAGLSFYELSAMLGVLNDNMIKGSRAGRGLQQVLVHIAKDPYEIVASFIELAKHMNVPLEVYEKLQKPIANMSTMELMREFSNIVKASGKSLEALSREMDKFGMIGGRTLAPLLLNFDKVDTTVQQLILHSTGSTQQMAQHITTTIAANLRRVASYFEQYMYPVITGLNTIFSATLIGFVKLAGAMEGIQSKVISGSFGSIGMPGVGGTIDAFLKAATLIGSISILSAQLPDKFNLVNKALEWMGNRGAAGFEKLGAGFLNLLASTGPLARAWGSIVSGFQAGLSALSAGFELLKTTLISVNASIQSIGVGATLMKPLQAGLTAASAAALYLYDSIKLVGLGRTIMDGLITVTLALGTALKAVGAAMWAHPVLAAIGLIAGAFAIAYAYVKIWKKSVDDVVAESIESAAKYQEKLTELEQKSIQAHHALSNIKENKEAYRALISGAEDSATATDKQRKAFDDLMRSAGIESNTMKDNTITVGELKQRFSELTPEVQENVRALNAHYNAVLSNKELQEKFIESLRKQVEAMEATAEAAKKAKQELAGGFMFKSQDSEVSAKNFTNWIRTIFMSKEERLAFYEEQRAAVKDAENSAREARNQIAKSFESIGTLHISNPMKDYVKELMGKGKDETEIRDALEKAFMPPKNLSFKDWKPNIEGFDYDVALRRIFPDNAVLEKIFKEGATAEIFGAKAAKEIEKIDTSKASGMAEAKRIAFAALLNKIFPSLSDKTLESAGVKLGPEAMNKYLDALNRAHEQFLKTLGAHEQEVNQFYLKAGESAVGAMKQGYDAQAFATEAFGMEMTRLNQDYIRTQQEFAEKRQIIERKHAETGREVPKVEMDTLNIEEQTALLKVRQQQFELAKKIGDLTAKAWQEGAGEVLKYQYSMKNLEAKQKELQATEKLSEIEKKLAENVRVSMQEAEEAHRLKMEYLKLEAEGKKLEIEYNKTSEEMKLNAVIRESQMLLAKDAVEKDERLKLTDVQKQMVNNQIAMAERQLSQLSSLMGMQMAVAQQEMNTKVKQEDERAWQERGKIAIHNLRTMLEGQAAVVGEFYRTQMPTGASGGDSGTSKYFERGVHGSEAKAEHIVGRLEGLDPEFMKRLKGLADEYYQITGKVMRVSDAFRSYQEQVDLKKRKPTLAATPGYSMHGYGLAVDIDTAQANEMATMGLLEKWNIYRPMLGQGGGKNEPWHLQPTGMRAETVKVPMNIAVDYSAEKIPPASVEKAKLSLAGEMQAAIDEMLKMLKERGEKAQPQIKKGITELFNTLKDLHIDPKDIDLYSKFFDSLKNVAIAAGMPVKKIADLITEAYKKQFDQGVVFDVPLLVKYTAEARAAGGTDEQVRKRVQETFRVAFEHEENWTKDRFQGMMDFISNGVTETGISGKKVFAQLMTDIFTPSKLQIMLDSDIDLIDMFYQQIANLGRKLTNSDVTPTKIGRTFETAIRGIISSGEELAPEKYEKLVNALSQIPRINLKEAASDVEKYWQAIGNTRALSMPDLGTMQRDMMRFGSTSDEVWKAIGDVADVQIRRMYASWEKGSEQMKGDFSTLKELSGAFWLGMLKGVADYASKLKDPIRRLAGEITEILNSMQSSLESIISDTLKGDFKGWNEYLTKFGENLINIASKNMSEMIMQSLTSWVGDAMGIKKPRPGEMSQKEAESFGAKEGERQSRANIEQTMQHTEKIKTGQEKVIENTKRIADNVAELIDVVKQKGGEHPSETRSGTTGGERTSESGERVGGISGGGGETGVGPIESEASEVAAVMPSSKTSGAVERAEEKPLVGYETEGWDAGLSKTEIEEYKARGIPVLSEDAGVTGEIKEETRPDFGFLNPLVDYFYRPEQPFIFHSGGIVPGSGDVPAILEGGEGVISKSAMKKFAEGGEVENPLQGLMSGIGQMVQGMLAPITDSIKSPRQQQIAQIGEGNYADTFMNQVQYEKAFQQERDMYRQIDAQKYAQSQQQQLQQWMQGGPISSMFGLGGGGGLGGVIGGGLGLLSKIGMFFAEGGLVPAIQWLASGGPILQKNINYSLYSSTVGQSNWPTSTTTKESWFAKYFPYLAIPMMLMLSYGLSGRNKKQAAAQADTDAFVKRMQQKLESVKTPEEAFAGKDLLSTGLPGAPSLFQKPSLFSQGLFKTPDLSSSIADNIFGEEFAKGGLVQYFASGGNVLTTRSAAETSWQNMGHTETVYTDVPSAWQMIIPGLMLTLLLPMLMKKKRVGEQSTDVTDLKKKYTEMVGKSPDLKPKSIGDLWKERDSGKSMFDMLGNGVKLNPELTGISDLQAKLDAAKAIPSGSSGGFLNTLIGGPSRWLEGLQGVGSSLWSGISGIGSSLWSGISSIGSGIGSLFSGIGSWFGSLFNRGGLVRKLAGGGYIADWGVSRYSNGGPIGGAGTTDTVPAMLTPGEFVVNRQTVGMFGPQFFHALQDMAKFKGVASPESVLAGMSGTLKFAAGGAVPIPKLPNVAVPTTEHKITVANVMDEESVGQFLNTKKYGEVLVNKLGGGVSQRLLRGQGV